MSLVEVLFRVERELYHWPIGRKSFTAIGFVATSEGIPTGLQFQRGSNGPYAPGLKDHTSRLLNHNLIRETQLGKMFSVSVGPSYHVAQEEYRKELDKWNDVIDSVADLFVRLRTNQAEIVATVLYAGRELAERMKSVPTESEVFSEVMAWKEHRRPPLTEAEVASTIRNMAMLGRLKVKASADLPLSEGSMADI
jgi:hypothetical protein